MQESTIRRKVEDVIEIYNQQKELLRSIQPTIKKVLSLGDQMQRILDDLDGFVEDQEEDEDGFVEYESIFSDALDEVDVRTINDENIAEILFEGSLKPTPLSAIRRVLEYAKEGE
jgi:hypothetical protein